VLSGQNGKKAAVAGRIERLVFSEQVTVNAGRIVSTLWRAGHKEIADLRIAKKMRCFKRD